MLRYRCWMVLLTITLLSAVLDAQESDVPPSHDRNLIPSWPIDPHMTAAEERRLMESLSKPIRVVMSNQEPLSSVVRFINDTHPSCRLFINEPSLDEIGLTSDVPVTCELEGTVGQVLSVVLSPFDLTFSLQSGRMVIETPETAEFQLNTRVYDVTTIVADRDPGDRITDVIQYSIEPETWEMTGGPATIVGHQIGTRKVLVISATTTIHLKVRLLLERFAQIGSPYRHRPLRPRSPSAPPEQQRYESLSRLPRFTGS